MALLILYVITIIVWLGCMYMEYNVGTSIKVQDILVSITLGLTPIINTFIILAVILVYLVESGKLDKVVFKKKVSND